MQPYFFDIGHPCYGQLTPVKTRYPMTSIMWPYCGLKFTAHRGHMFFVSLPLTKCWFSIGLWAHVSEKGKKGWINRKQDKANTELKVC